MIVFSREQAPEMTEGMYGGSPSAIPEDTGDKIVNRTRAGVIALILLILIAGTISHRYHLEHTAVIGCSARATIFLLLLASLSFRNAFRREATYPVRIPKRLVSPFAKTFSRLWVKRCAMDAALLFGGIAAVLEFPCTGSVYAAIIVLLLLQRMASMTYFLGYNVMFIVPLIILLALSYSITSAQSLKEIGRHEHLSRGVSALLLLSLGILLLIR